MRSRMSIWSLCAVVGLLGVLSLVSCDDGGGVTADTGPAQKDTGASDVDTAQPDPVFSQLEATVTAPWYPDGQAFSAKLARECRFIKPGQLIISGTSAGADGYDTVTLRIGVSETVDLASGPREIDLSQTPDDGVKDVGQGTAAIGYSFEPANGGVAASLSTVEPGSKVVLTSLDPCEGTFQANIAGILPGGTAVQIEIADGVFKLTRTTD